MGICCRLIVMEVQNSFQEMFPLWVPHLMMLNRWYMCVILIYQQNMPFQLAAKKAGLSVVRGFLHAIEGIKPAVGEAVQKRNTIGYKFKSYRDGKVVNIAIVENLEDAFPCRGDKK